MSEEATFFMQTAMLRLREAVNKTATASAATTRDDLAALQNMLTETTADSRLMTRQAVQTAVDLLRDTSQENVEALAGA